jgi:nucleotide-binding universal stress UspA family protein
MHRYKHLLVVLNLDDQDRTTIKYAAMVSRMAQSEEVYFLYVADDLDIPEFLRKDYPELLPPVNEFARAQVKELVGNYFDGHPGSRKIYEIVEGLPLTEVLRLTRRKQIDLVLTGQSIDQQVNVMLPVKVARKAPCSVLTVPEAAGSQIKNILVPVDFSEISVDVIDVATAVASDLEVPGISLLHVYRVPAGYYKTGKTYEVFGEILKKHPQNHYQELIDRCDLRGVTAAPLFRLHHDPAKMINKVVYEQGIDLVVIGARGRSNDAAALLGGVTEQVIRSARIPLMVVKKKGERLRLLDALLEL